MISSSSTALGSDLGTASIFKERKILFRGLDVVGYVPGVGSISGVIRMIIAQAAIGFCKIGTNFSKNNSSQWQIREKYLNKEFQRGVLEVIPFFPIFHDIGTSNQEKNQNKAINTVAYGRFYIENIKGDLLFSKILHYKPED